MPQIRGKPKKTSSDSKRHFTVVMGGKEHGLYVSSTPSSAAKKAVTKLCAANKSKKVEFSIREITQGSKKKTYGPYKGYIEKLKEPIELKGRVIKYKPVAKLGAKKGVQKGGNIDYFCFVITGNDVEMKNITDEEIKKLLKDIDVKIEISRKMEEVVKKYRNRNYIDIVPIEIVIKITPNTYSNNRTYLGEFIFFVKHHAIDRFRHFFLKKTRQNKSIKIFVRTYTDENTYHDEEITQSIKDKISNNLNKKKLIRISFFVFKDEIIIDLIKKTINKLLREEIFNGPYDIDINDMSINFIGRTVLRKEQLEEKIENIYDKLLEIENVDNIKKDFEDRYIESLISLSPIDLKKKIEQFKIVKSLYKAPFQPRISEFKNSEFVELINNSDKVNMLPNMLPNAPPLNNQELSVSAPPFNNQ
jgi:hypothetical protein